MALHRYFKPISGKLPDPNVDLSKEMPSAAIKEANKREVSCVISTNTPKIFLVAQTLDIAEFQKLNFRK